MKFLLITILLSIFSSFNAQVYLNVNVEFPTNGGTIDGKVTAELINYIGTVNYSIVLTDILNPVSGVYIADTNFIDTLKANRLVDVYAYNGIDTLAYYHQVVADSGFYFDTASLVLYGASRPLTNSSCDGAFSGYTDLDSAAFPPSPIHIEYFRYLNKTDSNFVDVRTLNAEQFLPENLCSGFYRIFLKSIYGYTRTEMSLDLSAQIQSANNPTFMVQVFSSLNAPDSCYAVSNFEVTGTSAPYQFSVDNSQFSVDSSRAGLCSGSHLLLVVDANNDTLAKYFAVADSANVVFANNNSGSQTYSGQAYVDSMTVDFQNCNFDYSTPVDSSNILSLHTIGGTSSIYWEMEIWQNGVASIYADTIIKSTIYTGWNHCYIVFHCPVKSELNKVVRIETNFYVESSQGLNNFEEYKVLTFPNPVIDALNFISEKASRFIVTDITGKKVMQGVANQSQVDVSSLISGVYLFTLVGTNEEILGVSKFVKK